MQRLKLSIPQTQCRLCDREHSPTQKPGLPRVPHEQAGANKEKEAGTAEGGFSPGNLTKRTKSSAKQLISLPARCC